MLYTENSIHTVNSAALCCTATGQLKIYICEESGAGFTHRRVSDLAWTYTKSEPYVFTMSWTYMDFTTDDLAYHRTTVVFYVM